MGEKVKTYAVRLDPQVAEFYDQLANSEGIRTSKLFSKILTNDFQSIAVKQQADRIEDLVNRLEKRIDDFEEDNNFSEKYYEDFSGLYFMMLWLLMALLHKDLKCKAPLIEPNLRRNLGKW
ncbi:hypothetical protein, partial [Acinetobacter baumannii]|uniref:hypothetical protein n=1 Tax=Acinetobacter baumannii TaxID=470 RepID=UPI001D0D74A7